jgi:alpha-1,2-mannosyltransferase
VSGATSAARSHAGMRDRPAVVVASLFLLGLVPVACAAFFLAASYANDSLAYDFRNAYLPAASAVLDGETPYVETDDPRLAAEVAYVYPPPLAYALTPLTALSESAAVVVVTLVGAALVLGVLMLLDVRDWRCYGVMLVWAPVLIGLQTGSASLLVAFAAAVVWRFRGRLWPPAVALGLAVAVKLFVWPLLVWLLATRRVRVAVLSVGVGAATVLASWAALGFEDLTRYPALLRRLSDLEAAETYSLVGVAAAAGLPESAGVVLSVLAGGALLAAAVAFSRRGDDLRSFTSAIAASLALTPIVWQHYLILLLVPLAIARPRLSALWFLPVLAWVAPREDNGAAWQTPVPLLVATAIVLAVLLSPAAEARDARSLSRVRRSREPSLVR